MNQGKLLNKICRPGVFAACFIAFSCFYLTTGRHCELVPRIIFKLIPILIMMAGLMISLRCTSDRKTIVLPIIALACSALGDAFGEMKGTSLGSSAFAVQISFFAVAQIVYCLSFLRFFNFKGRASRLVYDLLALLVIAFFTWFAIKVMPNVEIGMRPFVVGYFMVILAMALSAMMQEREWHGLFAAGAILFFLSDSAIAYGLYVGSFPHRGTIVMSTYFAAQFLLNVSLLKSHKSDE